jgi:hypothetical protein
MGVTLDVLRGRVSVYVTCDNCGHPILGRVVVETPANPVMYDRYMHADGECPDEAQREIDPAGEANA